MSRADPAAARAAIAAGHRRTAEAARLALAAGGNAFDAIVAAAWAACVAEPVLASLGGGGFLMARPAGQPPQLYDFFAHTPMERKPPHEIEFVRIVVPFGTTSQEFHVGSGAAATPGMVAGLFRIHRDLGSVPMAEVLEPAITWARAGVEINRLQAYLFAITAAIFGHTAEAQRIFGSRLQPGASIQQGELLQLPELGATLEALAHEGDELYYRGELGRRIAAFCARTGGQLTRRDLERYRVERRQPLRLPYRSAELLLNPPPASGGALVAFGLKLLESVDLSSLAPNDSRFLTTLARTMQGTNQARAHAYDGLEHETSAESVLLHDETVAQFAAALAPGFEQGRGTTHISIIDDADNVAAMTLTNGEGCGHVVDGTGVMLNNMLGEEDVHPQGFHRWQPDARIASMMAPTIATHGPQTIATGSGGSNRIRTCILQVLVKLLDFDWPVEQAVNSPRLHLEGERLAVEGGFTPEQVAELGKSFSNLQVWDERNLYFGGAHTVVRDRQRGVFSGAGDVRRGGVVVLVE